MGFRFTSEDFERYVTKQEHGGAHIWDGILKELHQMTGIYFSPNPWERRGDWLKTLWFIPKRTSRSNWQYQAMYFLSRDIDRKILTFGLEIEYPHDEFAKANQLDLDRDAVRLITRIKQDPEFCEQLDSLLTQPQWMSTLYTWEEGLRIDVRNSEMLREGLDRIPKDAGWAYTLKQQLSAEQAITLGDQVAQRIVQAYRDTHALWMAVIPRADFEHLRSRQPKNNDERILTQEPAPVLLPSFDLAKILETRLRQQGLHYTPWQIATFYTAVQTKGFVILSGISGTGKTKLAQAFAAMLPSPRPLTSDTLNHLFIPVRPDWRDSKSLLGFYNPLTGSYQWTPFLRFLQRAVHSFENQDGLAWFVILDEMNLARVEYYFADLLSVLESGRDDDGWTRETLRLYYPDEAEGDLPPNGDFRVNLRERTNSRRHPTPRCRTECAPRPPIAGSVPSRVCSRVSKS